jgi:hypothetical protein
MQPTMQQSSDPMTSGGSTTAAEDAQYLSIEKLKNQYYDYLTAKQPEVEEAREALLSRRSVDRQRTRRAASS